MMTLTDWIQVNSGWIAFGGTVLVFVYYILEAIETFSRRTAIFVLLLGLILSVYLAFNIRNIVPADHVQIMLLLALLAVTGIYASSTAEMAREMREQRIVSSRPLIVLRAVSSNLISPSAFPDHFELYNAGNGSAVEVQVSLVLQRKTPYGPHNGERLGFLLSKDAPREFYTTFPPDIAGSTFYVVAEYQGVSSHKTLPVWYQTWLSCKLGATGMVISGELEFDEDIPEQNRIGLFHTDFSNGRELK